MSDNFIPLNQSTPVHGNWQNRSQNQSHRGHQNKRFHNNQRRGHNHNRWGNNSQRNSSYGSDSNSSCGQDNSIDAYLHPSMLQDPWASLRK